MRIVKRGMALALTVLLAFLLVNVGSAEEEAEAVLFESRLMADLTDDASLWEYMQTEDMRAQLARMMMAEYMMEVPEAAVEALPVYIGTFAMEDILLLETGTRGDIRFCVAAFAVTLDGARSYLEVIYSDMTTELTCMCLNTDDPAVVDAMMDTICETHWNVELDDPASAASDLRDILAQ